MNAKFDSPMVNVIIPTYNRAHCVGNAINSVLRQTYKNFECIVVDDGSADESATRKAVEPYLSDRVRFIRQENKGVSAARNTGIKASCGEFFAFLDDDDVFLPDKLLTQSVQLSQLPKSIGAVYGRCYYVKSNGSRTALPTPNKIGLYEMLVNTEYIHTTAWLFRRECFDKAGLFDEAMMASEDRDMWMSIALAGFEFVMTPEFVSERRENLRPHAFQDPEMGKKWTEFSINKFFNDPRLPKSLRGFKTRALQSMLMRVGNIYLHNGNLEKGIASMEEAIDLDPKITSDRKWMTAKLIYNLAAFDLDFINKFFSSLPQSLNDVRSLQAKAIAYSYRRQALAAAAKLPSRGTGRDARVASEVRHAACAAIKRDLALILDPELWLAYAKGIAGIRSFFH